MPGPDRARSRGRPRAAAARLAPLALLLLARCGAGSPAPAAPFESGADLSFLDELEQRGQVFRGDDGAPGDALLVLRDHGLTAVRLRVWNAPAAGFCDLQRTLRMAARAQAAGLSLLLDLHYSDHWADPAKQVKPAAWSGLHGAALEDAVEEHTRAAVAALAAQGTPAATVQLGNEITGGLLWDDGRVGGGFGTPAQWDALAGLLQAGARGVRAGAGAGPAPRIALHLDRGGDNAGARWFFDHLISRGVPFEVIALSYYPWWHGDLAALSANLDDLAARYGRPLLLAETAYPWTLDDADAEPDFVSSAGQLLPGYPATREGQRAFLTELRRIVRAVPGGLGRGVYWWAPEWLAVAGMSEANPWDNQTLFDAAARPLPAMSALGGQP